MQSRLENGETMNKTEVYDYFEANGVESARFVKTNAQDENDQTVVEIYDCEHNSDLMVVEIWHGEHLGNHCLLSTFRNEKYDFSVADDSLSSEMLMDDAEDE